jgi:hypothetical protein
MPTATKSKTIHYMRAFYGVKPSQTLSEAVNKALAALPKMRDTEVTHPEIGTLAVRHRDTVANGPVRLAVGLGVKDEAMSTMGMQVSADMDQEVPEPPPLGRMFKLADAFCLIDENEILVCTDGGIRASMVRFFISGLLSAAGLPSEDYPSELRARLNADVAKTLALEGIKELHIKSTAYLVSKAKKKSNAPAWFQKWISFANEMTDTFRAELKTQADRTSFAQHVADLNVTTVISVTGGSRGEEAVIAPLQDIASEAWTDSPTGAEIELVTKKGTPVKGSSVILTAKKSIKKLQESNALDHLSAWQRLDEFRNELWATGRWKT